VTSPNLDAGEKRRENQRRIGAYPEEHAFADGDLTGIAADDVPRRRRYRCEQKRNADIAREGAREYDREQQQRGCQQSDAQAGRENSFHAFPIRPCGRSQSSATNRP
jgi:hypothetical protein